MRSLAMVISLSSILAPAGAHAQEIPTDAQVRLEMVLRFKNGSYQLEERLTSNDSRSFVLRRSELPWGEGRSLHLDTFIPDSGGAKLAGTPLGPPARDTVRLEAGGSLSGQLNLGKHFAGLEKMVPLHPLVIHWAYQFRAAEPAVAGPWQAGSFVIPRGGLADGAALP